MRCDFIDVCRLIFSQHITSHSPKAQTGYLAEFSRSFKFKLDAIMQVVKTGLGYFYLVTTILKQW